VRAIAVLDRPLSPEAIAKQRKQWRDDKRKSRARIRAGQMVVNVKVDRTIMDWLASPLVDWLTPNREVYSKAEVEDAIQRALDWSARNTVRR